MGVLFSDHTFSSSFTARFPGQASFLASLLFYSPPPGSGVLSLVSRLSHLSPLTLYIAPPLGQASILESFRPRK